MDLGSAADELYAIDPDAFIARRAQIVKELRAAKQREAANRVAALRRPTRSAWLVNLLARWRGDELGDLLELGPALAQAHTGGTPEELRSLTTLRRRAVSGLVDAALTLGRNAGYRPSDAVRDEVSTTLEAALVNPEFAEAVLAGSLSTAAESAANFPTELFAGLALPTWRPQLHVVRDPEPNQPVKQAPTPEPQPEPDEHDEVAEGLRRAEIEARQQALESAEQHQREAEAILGHAQHAFARAGARATQVEAHTEDVRSRTGQARDQVEELREALARAQAALEQGQDELVEAEAAQTRAEAELTQAQRAAEETENQVTSARAEAEDAARAAEQARARLAELETP